MMLSWRDVFKKFSPVELASIELVQAETELLSYMSARDYAIGMVAYNEARIIRLRKYISANDKHKITVQTVI